MRTSRRGFLIGAVATVAALAGGLSWIPARKPTLYGDGVHDDTEAIQWMLDHGGGNLPEGEYILSRPLKMNYSSGPLVGAGAGRTTLNYQGYPGPAIEVS